MDQSRSFAVRWFDDGLFTPQPIVCAALFNDSIAEILINRSHPKFFVLSNYLADRWSIVVHVKLRRRYLLSRSICTFDCSFLDVEVSTTSTSRVVVHYDPITQSASAKRGRDIDPISEFELEYRAWRFSDDT
uniref:p17 protein n=1 Tax=Avian orthoreovirus TaxID=38170 RepID=A3E173_9REOV|nr:p17 protein [Avian orthoreovirus]